MHIIKDNVLVYKLFEKRGTFLFDIVRMPYLSSNIPSIFRITAESSMYTKADRLCARGISITY